MKPEASPQEKAAPPRGETGQTKADSDNVRGPAAFITLLESVPEERRTKIDRSLKFGAMEGRATMKRIIFISSLFALGVIGMATISRAQTEKAKTEAAMPAGMSKVALRMEMRKLWEDHLVYTRNYIISALADLGDADAVAARLLKNQDEIGDAIKPFYGEEAGKKLSALLRDHIMIAAEVVKEAKLGNDAGLAKAQAKWTANADEIAGFLSGANPHWMKKDMTDMLHKHLEYTTGEVVSRLKKDWAADIGYYDKGHAHMLMFADVLTMGLEKQFPDKFKK